MTGSEQKTAAPGVPPRERKAARKGPRKGSRIKDPAAATRKCIVSGASGPKDGLIRCVVGPDGQIVADLSEKLPGRGIWVSSGREAIDKAVAGGLFARAARTRVKVPLDFADQVEDLLIARVIRQLGLVQKAGRALTGFEKVVDCVEKGRAFVLLEASDGAADGRNKLLRKVNRQNRDHNQSIHVVGLLNSADLSLAFGHQHVIHAALKTAPVAKMALRDLVRLAGFRPIVPSSWNGARDEVMDPGQSADRRAGQSAEES